MSEETEVVQTEAEQLASMMAGYNGTRGDEPPVEVDTNPSAEMPAIELHEPSVSDLAEELKALKAKVSSSHSDPADMRRLHGEIGNINRTLKQLQTPPPAPVIDDSADELDAVAAEFPELAGPLVKAIKAARQGAPQEDFDARVTAMVKEIRQTDAIESLSEEHPDYQTVRETPEYAKWLSSKTPAFQERFTTTWNPDVVARGLTDFKDSLKTRERKQNRLESAVTPQGNSSAAKPSTLPDEAGLWAGYNRGPKRLNF